MKKTKAEPAKYCADPCCGKLLKKRDGEHDYNWKIRQYCGKKCAGTRKATTNASPKPKSQQWYGLATLNVASEPDLCHSLVITNSQNGNKTPLAIARTEEEIDRLYEYNRMMGRRH